MIRDSISRLTPEKARAMRQEYEAQVKLEREKYIAIKNRKHKIVKKLDKDLADCEERIQNSLSIIEAVDNMHFDTQPIWTDDGLFDEIM